MNSQELKDFLDSKVVKYNTKEFIDTDPVQIPHLFSKKEDVEIAAFLAATISWGKREMILKSCYKIVDALEHSPYDFVMNHSEKELDAINTIVHRTFNSEDFRFFITALKNIYNNHGGLETVFSKYQTENSLQPAIHEFKKTFFSIPHPSRTTKHVSDPLKNSAAKRINMFLRWMVREDNFGVDLGIWKSISPSLLSCPLDVHTGNVGRKLGFITRKQNDAKTLLELDTALRKLDPTDPVKYDFALFGLGIFENF